MLQQNFFDEWVEVQSLTLQIGNAIPENVDWKPLEDMNSLGMISRHLILSRYHHFKNYLGRKDIEYPQKVLEKKPISRDVFISLLEESNTMIKNLLTELTTEDLNKEAYKWKTKSYPISWVVWNLKGHERWHQAQMKLYLKLMGEDTSKIGH